MYEKNNWYIWDVEIYAATKLTILNQNLYCKYRNQHMLIYTSFQLHGKFCTENKQGNSEFCGMHGIFWWRCIEEEEKEYYVICKSGVVITTNAKLLDIKYNF